MVGGLSVWSTPSMGLARDVWTATFQFLDNPMFDTGLIVIGFMLAYHTINGIRLTLTEFGWLQGKPSRPDFPYEPKSFTKSQRAFFWFSILFATATAVYALTVFFGVWIMRESTRMLLPLHNWPRNSHRRRNTPLHCLSHRLILRRIWRSSEELILSFQYTRT